LRQLISCVCPGAAGLDGSDAEVLRLVEACVVAEQAWQLMPKIAAAKEKLSVDLARAEADRDAAKAISAAEKDMLREALSREQARADRLEAALVALQRPWWQRWFDQGAGR